MLSKCSQLWVCTCKKRILKLFSYKKAQEILMIRETEMFSMSRYVSVLCFANTNLFSAILCLVKDEGTKQCVLPAAERWATEIWTVPAAVGSRQTRGYSSKPGAKRQRQLSFSVWLPRNIYIIYGEIMPIQYCVFHITFCTILHCRAILGLSSNQLCLLEEMRQSCIVYCFQTENPLWRVHT